MLLEFGVDRSPAVRENTGGAYFGKKIEEDDYAEDTWAYSTPEVERVARVAGVLAREHDPPLHVTSCDKANVLATGRLWRRVVSETFAKDFPEIQLSHQLIDSAAILLMKNPRSFNGVLLTENTYVNHSSCQGSQFRCGRGQNDI